MSVIHLVVTLTQTGTFRPTTAPAASTPAPPPSIDARSAEQVCECETAGSETEDTSTLSGCAKIGCCQWDTALAECHSADKKHTCHKPKPSTAQPSSEKHQCSDLVRSYECNTKASAALVPIYPDVVSSLSLAIGDGDYITRY